MPGPTRPPTAAFRARAGADNDALFREIAEFLATAATRLTPAGNDASSSRIDSPYLLSLDSPTPLIPASSPSVDGAATAIARSVASWKTT